MLIEVGIFFSFHFHLDFLTQQISYWPYLLLPLLGVGVIAIITLIVLPFFTYHTFATKYEDSSNDPVVVIFIFLFIWISKWKCFMLLFVSIFFFRCVWNMLIENRVKIPYFTGDCLNIDYKYWFYWTKMFEPRLFPTINWTFPKTMHTSIHPYIKSNSMFICRSIDFVLVTVTWFKHFRSANIYLFIFRNLKSSYFTTNHSRLLYTFLQLTIQFLFKPFSFCAFKRTE